MHDGFNTGADHTGDDKSNGDHYQPKRHVPHNNISSGNSFTRLIRDADQHCRNQHDKHGANSQRDRAQDDVDLSETPFLRSLARVLIGRFRLLLFPLRLLQGRYLPLQRHHCGGKLLYLF